MFFKVWFYIKFIFYLRFVSNSCSFILQCSMDLFSLNGLCFLFLYMFVFSLFLQECFFLGFLNFFLNFLFLYNDSLFISSFIVKYILLMLFNIINIFFPEIIIDTSIRWFYNVSFHHFFFYQILMFYFFILFLIQELLIFDPSI